MSDREFTILMFMAGNESGTLTEDQSEAVTAALIEIETLRDAGDKLARAVEEGKSLRGALVIWKNARKDN